LTFVYKENLKLEYLRIQTQVQRGTPRLNRDRITQVMEPRIAVFGADFECHWAWHFVRILQT